MESAPHPDAMMPPEVSPEDVWGDPACLGTESTLPRVLPRRKPSRKQQRNRPATAAADGGLRIDSWRQPRAPATADDAPAGLEVSEINGEVLRLAPEMPTVERVPALVKFMPRQPSGRKKRGGETGEWGRPQRHSLLWVFGAGTAIVAMVVGAMVMLPRVNRANTIEVRTDGTDLVIDQDAPDETSRQTAAMMLRVADAEALYDAAAATTSVDALLPLLRDSAAVEPLLRDAGWSKWLPRSRSGNAWSAFENDGLVFGLLEGTREDYAKFESYFVDDGGQLRIDWKASTGFGTATFSELAKGRGDSTEIRGKITPVDFYTMAMPEDAYRSYRLVSPDETDALWIYAEAGGEAAAKLNSWFDGGQILTGSKEQQKATLRLARPPEGALPNQWLVVELLHKEWIGP